MMAKSVECKCDPRFTCGYCLRNMKPYFFTPNLRSSESTITCPIVRTSVSFAGRGI